MGHKPLASSKRISRTGAQQKTWPKGQGKFTGYFPGETQPPPARFQQKQTNVHSQQVWSEHPGYFHEPFLNTKAGSVQSAVAGHTSLNQGLRKFFSLHLICRAHAPFLARTLENSLNAESWLYFLAILLSSVSLMVRMEQPKHLQSAGISHKGRLGTGDKKQSPTFQPGAFRV